MLERLYEKLKELEQLIEQTPFTILVFGSGETYPQYSKKRQDTINALRTARFTVYTCEQLSETLRSELYIVEQEALYLQEAEWVIFLDTSAGPLSELSTYCQNPDVVLKAFVLYPQTYVPDEARSRTYPEDVLRHYPHKSGYSQSQFDQCELVPICVEMAKALRYAKYSKSTGRPSALQF